MIHDAPTPAKADETTDLREAPTRSWSEMVEAIAKRCDLAVAINQHVGWDTDGADALGKLLRGMATRLDGAKDAVTAAEATLAQREAAHAAEIQAREAEIEKQRQIREQWVAVATDNAKVADRLAAENAVLKAALQPFATFAGDNVDAHGWDGIEHRASISTWFGPSDFRAARAALPEAITPKETSDGE